MRGFLVAVATLAAFTSALINTDEYFKVYESWDGTKPVQYVANFENPHEFPETHQEEHARRKRSAERIEPLMLPDLPIARTCEVPGYTGQFCEFPICFETNPNVDPEQYITENGMYPIDTANLGRCNRIHTTVIDDSLGEVRVEIRANNRVNPYFNLTDASGTAIQPDERYPYPAQYLAVYKNLVPGTYLVVPHADNALADCNVLVVAQTTLTISGGFVSVGRNRERDDFPDIDATQHSFNTIVLHANENRSPGTLKTVEVVSLNNMVMRNQLLSPRFGCAFEYYFDSFFCDQTGSYDVIVEGYDFRGFIFRRALKFDCLVNTRTEPVRTTTPVPTNPTNCSGHGVLVRQAAGGTTYCVCDDLWTGYDCSQVQCMNGGTPNARTNICECEIGYDGIHCENVVCDIKSGHGFNTDNPSINLVIRLRTNFRDVIDQVIVAMGQLVADLQFEPGAIYKFNLVMFNNDQILLKNSYDTVQQLAAAVLDAENFLATNDGGCTDSVYGGIATALGSFPIRNKSPVYIITDALPDDYDDDATEAYIWEVFYQIPLYFFYVRPTNLNCAPDVSDPGFRALDAFAAQTTGLAIFIDNRTSVREAVYQHIRNTFYHTQLMFNADRLFCDLGQIQHSVQVDLLTDSLVIMSKGRNMALAVSDPAGGLRPTPIVYTNGDFNIWVLNGPAVGQYFLTFTTDPATASCALRVYQGSALSTVTARAKPELFASFTNQLNSDNPIPLPILGMDNSPVFHLTNYFTRPDRVFASLNIFTYRGEQEVEIYASNGMWRDQCNFDFYFPPFNCKSLTDVFHYIFYARDPMGSYIQRSGSYYCIEALVPPINPGSCQNGGAPVPGINATVCICPPGFDGRYCERIECANGGTSRGSRCDCPPGFLGQFCELPTCTTIGPNPSYGTNRVDFFLVVEVTNIGKAMITALNNAAPEILRDLGSQSPQWINRVILIGFNSTWSGILADDPYSDYSNVLTQLNTLANSDIADTLCVVRTWEALHRAVVQRNGGAPRKSVINVFESSIPDNLGDLAEEEVVVENVRRNQHLLNVFQAFSPRTNGQFYCNANATDYGLIERAARRTEGRFYLLHASSVTNIVRMLPTFYSSGVVYRREFSDCLTSAQTVYFPIDSQSQTIHVIVNGYNPTITVTKADNSAVPDPITIVSDLQTGLTVYEYRKSCDDEWDTQDQYCIRFNPDMKNWQDAKTECVNFKGFIVDDVSAAKDGYLARASGGRTFWLGLTLVNGVWVFDYGDSTQAPATTFWQGGVAPNDPTRACAYFDPASTTGHWVAADCATQQLTVCQKHVYDDDNRPSRIGTDDISPGKYLASIQVTQPDADFPMGNACMAEIRVQSSVLIDVGFNIDLHGDQPGGTANRDSRENRIIASVSSNAEYGTATLSHALLYSFNDIDSTLLEATTYGPRAKCNYPLVSQSFSCEETNGNDFVVLHVGEDEVGSTFQRLSTGICQAPNNFCANGGQMYQGVCVCPDYFTGELCSTPICQNGGVLGESGRRCTCRPEFTGPACELPLCATNSTTRITNDGKSLVLLVEETANNREAINQLAANINGIVAQSIGPHSAWFSNYILHTFSASNGDLYSQSFTTVTDLQNALTQRANTATGAGACTLPIYEALAALLTKGYSLDGSPILLVTVGAPSVQSDQNIILYAEHFGTHSPRVNYIYTPADTFITCGGPVYNGDTFDLFYRQIVNPTMGILVKTSPDRLGADLTAFLPSRYGSTPIHEFHVENCQQEITFIQIDVNMTDLYIAVTNDNPSLNLIDPTRNPVRAEQVYKGPHQTLYHLATRVAGTYRVQLTPFAGTQCYASAYGQGGVQVIFGFVPATRGGSPYTSDDIRSFAIAGEVNIPVFHIVDPDDSAFVRGELFYGQIFRELPNHQIDYPYLSELRTRAGCTYSIYGEPFECPLDEALYVQVSGRDTYWQTFGRSIKTWCTPANGTRPSGSSSSVQPGHTTTLPTQPPLGSTSTTTPHTTTQPPLTPDQIQFDLFLLIDVSEPTQDFFFQQEEPWIDNLLSIYTIDQDHVRLGLVDMPGPNGRVFVTGFLSAYSNNASFVAALDNLGQPLLEGGMYSPGSPEQISGALQRLQGNAVTTFNGYRPNINNHLTIVITGTTAFDNPTLAVTNANAARANFGIITIGVGAGIDANILQQISGGAACTYVAPTYQDLLTNGTPFVQNLIWRAFQETGGAYC